MENLKGELRATYGEIREEVEGISDYLFNNPELSDQEYKSSKYLVEILKKAGFRVEYPYCGLDTSFRAEFGQGPGPSIGFIAEYDALPGYGDQEAAHACGHNWIGANMLGAALLMSKHMKAGRVVVIGSPAEETIGRKYDLVQAGAFKDIDLVMQMHLESYTTLETKGLALDAIEFKFYGQAAHAAQYPHKGINALDGILLTFSGINALREHLSPDVRVHGIINQGGLAPNVVPDFASAKFYIRAPKREDLDQVTQKVINCARGAGLMTGARMEHSYFENPFYDIVNNQALKQVLRKNMEVNGFNDISQEEEEFPGSTDIGIVSYACPTAYVNVGIDNEIFVHDKEFLGLANSPRAYELLEKATRALAQTGLELIERVDLMEEIRLEFEEIKKKEKWG